MRQGELYEYQQASERAVRQFNKSNDATPEQIHEAMAEFYDALKVGRVEIVVSENEFSEQLGVSEAIHFYDSGKSSERFCVSERVTALDETIIVYHIYPMEGEPDWTEEEQERVHTFIALLSAFNGKSRMAKLVTFQNEYRTTNRQNPTIYSRKLKSLVLR